MNRFATGRAVRALHWIGIALMVGAGLVVVGGIAFTASIDALLTASLVAVAAFALPGAAAWGLSRWLAGVARRMEERAVAALRPPPDAQDGRIADVARRYGMALAAVLAAWGARAALHPYVPDQVAFTTFYLGVAVAAWVGGVGPALLATVLSLVICASLYVAPASGSTGAEVSRYVLLALLGLVCVGIAALLITLRDALARSQRLAASLRRSDEAQSASDNRLRMLAQAAPVPLFIADHLLSCTYCNQAWLTMRGRTLTEEMGHGWWDGVHGEDVPRRREAFSRALTSQSTQEVTYRLRHADGAFRPVREVIAFRRIAKGEGVELLGACCPRADDPAGPGEAGD